MMNKRICKRLFLVGLALCLVLAGCIDPGGESNETAITALVLNIGGVEKSIDFGTGQTANFALSGSTTPTIPAFATVKSVTLSAGATGLKNGDVLEINAENRVAKIKITAKDGTTTKDYTVTVTMGAKLKLNTVDLSYAEVTTTAGTANDTGVAPEWGTPTPTGITYRITNYAPPGGGNGVAGRTGNSPAVAIDADGKITITADAEAVNSGTYTVTAMAGASSNYEANSEQTATVTVTIAKRNFSTVTLSYPATTIRAVAGYANDAGIAPAWDAVKPTPAGITYSIDADASATNTPTTDGTEGTPVVVINPDTGKITITAAAEEVNSGAYTVTATAGESSNYAENTTQTATVTVEITNTKVSLDTTSFTYTEVKATEGTANDSGVKPDWGDYVPPVGITYDISGGSSSGTTVVIDSVTGKITINDAATADHSGTYTVTVTAGADSNYVYNTTQTTLVTVTIAKRNLNTVPFLYASEVTTTEGTANDTGVELEWNNTGNDPVPNGITYSITGYEGDGDQDPGVEINPNTGKITITAQALVANNGDYTVTATAGETSNYLDGSTRTATVTVTIAKRNFSTVTLSYSKTTIKAVAGYANDTGIAPWGAVNPTPTGITYNITASTGENAPGTDGSGSAVAIDADGKITITAQALGANSGDYTVTATAGADSNYLNDGPLTATVTVEITDTKVSLANTSFTYTEVKAVAGTANDIGVSPDWGDFVPPAGVTYEISGGSSSGTTVVIDSDTGKITITAQALVANSGDYTVTATAGAKSNYSNGTQKTATVTVTIKLNLNTVTLVYNDEVKTAEGTANTTGVTPTWTTGNDPTPAEITYSITGYISMTGDSGNGVQNAGVEIVPDTGKITITANAIAANSGTYTVTATAKASSNYAENTTQTATVTVIIKLNLNTVGLSYTEVRATEGTANTTGVTPAWDGNPDTTGITYSITNYIGNGTDGRGDTVEIASDTGKITITDAATAVNSGTYTVTATAGPTSNYADTTTQIATVIVSIAKRNLSTVTLIYPESTIKAVEGYANDVGIEPEWTTSGSPTPEGITYSILGSNLSGPTTDGSTGETPGVAIDESTGKITITADAVADNAGVYTVTATAGADSNYLNGSPQTVDVTVEITVAKASLANASFTYTEVKATAGATNDIGVEPDWGDYVPPVGVTYSITNYAGSGTDGSTGGSPGVEINQNTGEITITATAVEANSGAYTVEATAGLTSNYLNGSKQTATVTVNVIVYEVGDTGPAGGTVFYAKDSHTNGWRYLEAAPSDEAISYPWGRKGLVNDDTETGIGSGKDNTANIVKDLGDNGGTDYAAKICNELVVGDFTDWFLPSKDELDALYKQRNTVGNFSASIYWSSSEDGSDGAWFQFFGSSGTSQGGVRGDTHRVRAVRSF